MHIYVSLGPHLCNIWHSHWQDMPVQADFEPNTRKLRGHERIPAIYESEVRLTDKVQQLVP